MSKRHSLKHLNPNALDPYEHNRIVKQWKQHRKIALASRRATDGMRRITLAFNALAAATEQAAANMRAMTATFKEQTR